MRSFHLFLLILVSGAGCSESASETENDVGRRKTVRILAAASLSESLEQVAMTIEQQFQETDIVISTGPSNSLAQQILAGAEADLFFSASRIWADDVEKDGLAAEGVDVLSNALVLIAPKGNPARIQSLNDVTSNHLRFFAMAGEHEPAGIYAGQALSKSGLLQSLEASQRIVRGHDVRATLAFVERGEAEAGIVYATDAKLSRDVVVISELDPLTHDPIVYRLILLRQTSGSEPSEVARSVFELLQAETALSQFESFSFGRLSNHGVSSVNQP
ncbi:MAG: molybdate ABC transporter substrate-binding protein [Planctomycetota bacterium]